MPGQFFYGTPMLLNFDDYQRAAPPDRSPAYDLHATDAFAFYFCGSRWMGGARPDSDWDFMATDSPELRTWLQAAGFRSLWFGADDNATYPPDTDKVTLDVVERTHGGDTVQVQLCADAARKFQVAQRVRDTHFHAHLRMTPGQRSALWAQLYRELDAADTLDELDAFFGW